MLHQFAPQEKKEEKNCLGPFSGSMADPDSDSPFEEQWIEHMCYILAEFTIPPTSMLGGHNILLHSTYHSPEIKGSA